jgi:hypothetical protein
LISIFDAQYELSPVTASEHPIEQCHISRAYMRVSGG